MVIVGMLSWWYTNGWKQCAMRVKSMLASLYDYFSLDLLIKTLFSPFRQISAGSVNGPLGVRIRAFFDKLISRMIGGLIRTFVLLIGIVVLVFATVFGLVKVILWPLLPVFPIVCVGLAIVGWVPWKI